MAFTKATRKKCKLKIALTGPTGSGKTKGALLIAQGLGGRIALLDSENDSASLYADQFDFDSDLIQAPYSPEAYIKKIEEAEAHGYDTLIIDSITPEWSGKGGALDLVDIYAKAKFQGNSWAAWNIVTPMHKAFIEKILQSRMNIICTMRSKMETAQVEGDNKKKKVVKLGLKAEQRDDIEYEFTVVLDIIHGENIATPSKDRTSIFMDSQPEKITVETGKRLKEWLDKGEDETPQTIKAHIKTLGDVVSFLSYFNGELPKKSLLQSEKIEIFAECMAHADTLGLVYIKELKGFVKKESPLNAIQTPTDGEASNAVQPE